MPRLARIVLAGVAHHVVQRGNNRQDVFFVPDDYRAYLGLLKAQCERECLKILAYCLMTNHVHLVATPEKSESLAQAVGRTDFLYTQYVNRLHGRSGHLWQDRFHSCALDEEHFWLALRYVEQNPLRAGMVEKAWSYSWSSAAAHVGAAAGDEMVDLEEWRRLTTPGEWRKALERPPRKEAVRALRKSTQRGWPMAGDSLLAKMEKILNRRLRALPSHRPQGARDIHPRKRREKRG